MAKQTTLNGYTELKDYLNTLKPDEKTVFILFTGSKSEDGQSWCGNSTFIFIIQTKCLIILKLR